MAYVQFYPLGITSGPSEALFRHTEAPVECVMCGAEICEHGGPRRDVMCKDCGDGLRFGEETTLNKETTT